MKIGVLYKKVADNYQLLFIEKNYFRLAECLIPLQIIPIISLKINYT